MRRARVTAVLVAFACGGAVAAEPHTVTIENKTGGVLRGVYVSAVGDDNWHLDRLQENVQPNKTVAIRLPDAGCRYDVRVLLEERPSEVLLFDVDVCKTPILAIDEDSGQRIDREVK